MTFIHPELKAQLPHLEAILFDLDGTLIMIDDQVVVRLAQRLRPWLGRHAYQMAHWLFMQSEAPGNALVTLLDALGVDEALMDFTDRLRRRRGVYPDHEFVLLPGVERMILALRERYRLAVVTARSRYHVERFLQRFPRMAAAMDTTCGLQDTRRLKPHPEPLLLVAERLTIPVDRCLMVGDTTVDVRAARRAGAWSAAVLCGFGRRAELERAGAHVILESTADLAGLLVLDGE